MIESPETPDPDWLEIAAAGSIDEIRRRIKRRVEFPKKKHRKAFLKRLDDRYETIFRLAHELYGWRWDFAWHLEELLVVAGEAAASRRKWMRRRDRAGVPWLHDGRTVWAMGYLERFCVDVEGLGAAASHLESLGITHLHIMPPYSVPPGPNDGGYAVSSYRELREDLGSMDDLRKTIKAFHRRGRSVVLDVVANHTADNHPWAEAAKRGEAPYDEFYLTFETREEVDTWLPELRMIFPDAGEPFVWRPDLPGLHGGRWVWSTFFDFQWDLDYRNPHVFNAMLGEVMFLANLGVAALRMDATPFLWKQKGTSCENLPQSHTLLQLMAAVVELVSPSVVFLSEAIVHPGEVARFVRPDECPLGYNPLLMALGWEALATGEVKLLADALANRMRLPDGAQWLTYVRSHDDIGWGFANEDAWRLWIDPDLHRRFLSDFYAGDVDGSWSTGARFQENPVTGDVRISGATASLAGLESATEADDPSAVERAIDRIVTLQTLAFTSIGIPMLLLGDEIASMNDYRYIDDDDLSHDNRWMHRAPFDWARLEEAESDPSTPHGRVLRDVRRLANLRSTLPGILGSDAVTVVTTAHPGVLAYRREGPEGELLVLLSFSPEPTELRLPEFGDGWVDAFDANAPRSLDVVAIGPYQRSVVFRPKGSG